MYCTTVVDAVGITEKLIVVDSVMKLRWFALGGLILETQLFDRTMLVHNNGERKTNEE